MDEIERGKTLVLMTHIDHSDPRPVPSMWEPQTTAVGVWLRRCPGNGSALPNTHRPSSQYLWKNNAGKSGAR